MLTKSQQLLYYIISEQKVIDSKIKLAKLEYLADFIHYAFNDTQISQDTNIYTRKQYGPLSRSLSEDIEALVLGDFIEETDYKYQPKKSVDLELSEAEIKTIHYVLNKYGRANWRDLVDISHAQAPYMATQEGGIIEPFTAYNLVDDYTDYAESTT